MKENGWVEEKNTIGLFGMFGDFMDLKKSLDTVIDEIIDNKDMKDTIIYLMPKDEKKKQILNLVQTKVESGNHSIIEGLKNTVIELEKEFCR